MAVRSSKKVAMTMLALGVASAAVVFGSYAAWTATTTNPGNSVTTGTLTLTSTVPNGTALITVTDLMPGEVEKQSVTIGNGGSGDVALSLAQSNVNQTASNALQLKIEEGGNCVYPTAATGACASYGAFNGSAGALASLSLGTLTTTVGRTFDVSVTLDNATTVNADQAKVNTFDLTWTGA
ncbi:MAG: TasA family protein [Gaiellales bacterium]